ncbi:MAG: ATP-binding protein [Chloroflexi bacterium]|nr:ATP-binding protein [Chloroflexota bacterium]
MTNKSLPYRVTSNELDVLRRRHREVFGDPTLSDAVLDRLVHNAYRLGFVHKQLLIKTNPYGLTVYQTQKL